MQSALVTAALLLLTQAAAPEPPAGKTNTPPPQNKTVGAFSEIPMSEAAYKERIRLGVLAATASAAEAKAAKELWKAGKVTEAEAKYRAILISQRPGMSGYLLALEDLADLCAAQGKKDEALSLYRQLVYVQPGQTWVTSRSTDSVVLMKFAILLYQNGQYDEALVSYQKGLKSIPKERLDFHMPLSPTMLAINRETAETPRLPFAAHLVIAVKQLYHDDADAVAHLREAVLVRPNFSLGHYYLGNILSRSPSTRQEGKQELEAASATGDPNVKQAAEDRLRVLRLAASYPPQKAAPPAEAISSGR